MGLWEEITDKKNLETAWSKVKSHNSAPGIDGQTAADFALTAQQQISQIREQLLNGQFEFSAVKVCNIRSGLKERQIGICTVRDKIVQNAVAVVLQRYFDPFFLPVSFAYRQGYSANRAVEKVKNFFQQGYHYIFKTDIEKFFDKMDHSVLLQCLSNFGVDEDTIGLVRKALRPYLFSNMEFSCPEEGTIQGSLCKALHNPPYAKLMIMQSKPLKELCLQPCSLIYFA